MALIQHAHCDTSLLSSSETDSSLRDLQVTEASVPATGSDQEHWFRGPASAMLGGAYPGRNLTHTLNISVDACHAFGMRPAVNAPELTTLNCDVWDVRKNAAGVVKGRLHSSPCLPGNPRFEEWMRSRVVGSLCLGLSLMMDVDVAVADNTMISFIFPVFREDGVGIDIMFGPLTIRPPLGQSFEFFGVCFPVKYVQYLQVRTRGLSAAVAWFELYSIQKTLGSLLNHTRIDHGKPTLIFSQPLPGGVDEVRTPYALPVFQFQWAANAPTVLEFVRLHYLTIGHLVIASPVLLSLNVMIPGMPAGVKCYFGACVDSKQTRTYGLYNRCVTTRLCDVVKRAIDADYALRVFRECVLDDFPSPCKVNIHTNELGQSLSYSAKRYGCFKPQSIEFCDEPVLAEVKPYSPCS